MGDERFPAAPEGQLMVGSLALMAAVVPSFCEVVSGCAKCEVSVMHQAYDAEDLITFEETPLPLSDDLLEALKPPSKSFPESFDLSDGDSVKENIELADMYSFRTRDALIKHFHLLVASSVDSAV